MCPNEKTTESKKVQGRGFPPLKEMHVAKEIFKRLMRIFKFNFREKEIKSFKKEIEGSQDEKLFT